MNQKNLNHNFLGEVPILEEISSSCDLGKPASFTNEKIYQNIFEKISDNFISSFSKIKKKK